MTVAAIEKGVPMPETRGPNVGGPKWPWTTMEVGDSFLIPDGAVKPASPYRMANMARRYGRKFAVRRVEGGHRIWRVA
jgi:hypothetical protein